MFSLLCTLSVTCLLVLCTDPKLVTYPNCRTELDGKCLSVFFFSPLTWGIVRPFLLSHCLISTRRLLDMMLIPSRSKPVQLKRVKFTLERAMETQRVSRGIADSFFDVGIGWGGWSTPRPRKETRYPLYRGWLGPGAGLDGDGKFRPHQCSIPGPPSP